MLPINWLGLIFNKYTIMAFIALGLVTFGAGCEHRRMDKKLEAQKAAHDAYVAEAESNVARIRAEGIKAQQDSESAALAMHRSYEALSTTLSEEIKRYEELKRVYLSERTVRLFNRSTRPAVKQEPVAGTSVQPQESAGTSEPSQVNLEQLMTVVVANNVKANACVDQYIELMKFYENIKASFH